jgi:hypothetical protein
VKIPFLKTKLPVGIVLVGGYWIFWGIDRFFKYFSELVDYFAGRGVSPEGDFFLYASLGMIVGLVLIATGIFIFMLKNWVRRIAIIQLFISVYFALVYLAYRAGFKISFPINVIDQILYYFPFQDPFNYPFLFERALAVLMWLGGFSLLIIIGPIIKVLFFVLTLYLFLYLTKREVKQYFLQKNITS